MSQGTERPNIGKGDFQPRGLYLPECAQFYFKCRYVLTSEKAVNDLMKALCGANDSFDWSDYMEVKC